MYIFFLGHSFLGITSLGHSCERMCISLVRIVMGFADITTTIVTRMYLSYTGLRLLGHSCHRVLTNKLVRYLFCINRPFLNKKSCNNSLVCSLYSYTTYCPLSLASQQTKITQIVKKLLEINTRNRKTPILKEHGILPSLHQIQNVKTCTVHIPLSMGRYQHHFLTLGKTVSTE
jgi:hypothetical protein